MQMSFFDFEEFNELKAEAKKKEAPRKKKEEKQKKKWKTPHTFVILVAIIIIAAIATYLIPAGEFTRFKDAAT